MKRREFLALLGGRCRLLSWPLPIYAQRKFLASASLVTSGPEVHGAVSRGAARHRLYRGTDHPVRARVGATAGSTAFLPWPRNWFAARSISSSPRRRRPSSRRRTRRATFRSSWARPAIRRRPDLSPAWRGRRATSRACLRLGRACGEESRADPRNYSGRAPGRRRGQCHRSVRQAFPRANPKRRQDDRLDIHAVLVRANDELEGAMAAIARERADAVIIQGSLPSETAVDSALKYRLPSSPIRNRSRWPVL